MLTLVVPWLRLIACLALAWQPFAALAQDEDVQFWNYAIVSGNLGDETQLTVDATWRIRESARGGDQQSLRATIEQEVADGLHMGGGIAVFEAKGLTEIRPHQQLRWTRGRFGLLTRFEQRAFDQADRVELRLRQRLGYIHPISDTLSVSVTGEYLRLLQTRNRSTGQARDEWRGRALLQYEASDALSIAASYLAIHRPRPDQADRLSHVPQALVIYRF